ncbi:hypothetical protein KJ854_01625 [Patescibacteria group bacterium]|nr:hypothetical protein [Patescibacteria group bacterium]
MIINIEEIENNKKTVIIPIISTKDNCQKGPKLDGIAIQIPMAKKGKLKHMLPINPILDIFLKKLKITLNIVKGPARQPDKRRITTLTAGSVSAIRATPVYKLIGNKSDNAPNAINIFPIFSLTDDSKNLARFIL